MTIEEIEKNLIDFIKTNEGLSTPFGKLKITRGNRIGQGENGLVYLATINGALRKNLCKFNNSDKKRYCEWLEKQPLNFLQYTSIIDKNMMRSTACKNGVRICSRTVSNLNSTVHLTW